MSNKKMKQTIIILAAIEALILIPAMVYVIFFK
jgi:hypothetical protein